MTLKELRKSKRITQVDAAKVCNVSLRKYKRLEKNDRYVDSLKYQKCISILSNLKKNSVPNKNKYNIAVIGAGYVGLSIGVLLSEYHNVTLVDINEEKVNLINNKISPIKDDDIDYYLQ